MTAMIGTGLNATPTPSGRIAPIASSTSDSVLRSGSPLTLVVGNANTAYLHQLEAQAFQLPQHPVQRRLVFELAAEHRFDRQFANAQVKPFELGGERTCQAPTYSYLESRIHIPASDLVGARSSASSTTRDCASPFTVT
jgi:hypothetical protein